MKWDFPQFHVKFGVTERFDENTIPIHTADMDFRCAKPIQDAMMKVAEHNIYGYTAAFAEGVGMKYHEAIINWFKRRNGWEIKPEEIVYINGTVEAIRSAILSFSNEGDGIMITRPIYTPFTSTILATHRTVVNSPLVNANNDGYYTIDFEDFEKKAADEKTKVFLLCSPHNPTGRIWTSFPGASR